MSGWPIRFRLPACMGGMCGIRETCARYHQQERRYPAERLCAHGMNDVYHPITKAAEHAREHHTLALIHGVGETA